MTEILKQVKAGVTRLPLVSPLMPGDLYDLSFDDILDYLEALGDLRPRWCH